MGVRARMEIGGLSAPRNRFGGDSRARVDAREILLGAVFAVLGCAVLAALLASGHILTGGENQVAADQLQYLSWIVSSSKTGVIENLWTIPAQTGGHFVGPGFLLSGLLVRVGVDPIIAYQVWKPVAIALLVSGFALYVRRLIRGRGPRAVALALALFGLSPVGALTGWGRLSGGWRAKLEFAAGEIFAGGWIWGYMMTAIAVALVPLGLLASEKALRSDSPKRWVALASVAALTCSWLQPWQGAELVIAIVASGLLASGGHSRRHLFARHGGVVLAGVVPLIYYKLLSSSDPSWRLAGEANNAIGLWPPVVWVAAFAPFVLALPAWLTRPSDWQEWALRIVPLAMLAEYFLIAVTKTGTFPFHAVQGMGLFMAILTVKSGLAIRDRSWWAARRWLLFSVLFILCVPGTLHRLNLMRLELHRSAQPYFLTEGEDHALDHLDRIDGAGGVLAPIKAALVVPSRTGRPVWTGQISWTPDFRSRVAASEALFNGELSVERSRDLVTASGARFVYADCGHQGDLSGLVADGTLKRPTTFGCARVFEVRKASG